jgi:two-component sensor histidine kinase
LTCLLLSDRIRLEPRLSEVYGPGYPAEVLQLDRHNVGVYLIQTMVRDGLGGELALHNDRGAVTTIRFKKDPSGF